MLSYTSSSSSSYGTFTFAIVALLLLVEKSSAGFFFSSSNDESGSDICPGSPAWVHAECKMMVTFQESCDVVKNEMVGRMEGKNGWVDPHNGGKYTLESVKKEDGGNEGSGYKVEGKRRTGNDLFTDKFAFLLVNDGSGCVAQACSESQVHSVLDFSTNYCNLHCLYCNKEDHCPIVHSNLHYKETYEKCSQNVKSKCTPYASS